MPTLTGVDLYHRHHKQWPLQEHQGESPLQWGDPPHTKMAVSPTTCRPMWREPLHPNTGGPHDQINPQAPTIHLDRITPMQDNPPIPGVDCVPARA